MFLQRQRTSKLSGWFEVEPHCRGARGRAATRYSKPYVRNENYSRDLSFSWRPLCPGTSLWLPWSREVSKVLWPWPMPILSLCSLRHYHASSIPDGIFRTTWGKWWKSVCPLQKVLADTKGIMSKQQRGIPADEGAQDGQGWQKGHYAWLCYIKRYIIILL